MRSWFHSCEQCLRSIVLPKVRGVFLKRESEEIGEINAKQLFELCVMLHMSFKD